LHAVNCRSNHVHVVVTANRDPDEVREQFKAWCTRRLKQGAGADSPGRLGRRCVLGRPCALAGASGE
jgi:hypothetical protein